MQFSLLTVNYQCGKKRLFNSWLESYFWKLHGAQHFTEAMLLGKCRCCMLRLVTKKRKITKQSYTASLKLRCTRPSTSVDWYNQCLKWAMNTYPAGHQKRLIFIVRGRYEKKPFFTLCPWTTYFIFPTPFSQGLVLFWKHLVFSQLSQNFSYPNNYFLQQPNCWLIMFW